MENKEIIAGNKLIAEFLGYKYYPYNHPEILAGDKYGNKREPGWKLHVDASPFTKFNIMRSEFIL
jgi:hypothetical protein